MVACAEMKSSVVAALLLFHKGVGLSTKSAIKYAVEAQKLERELTEVALYKPRSWSAAQSATKCALWGEKLERELAGIDPDIGPAGLEAQHGS